MEEFCAGFLQVFQGITSAYRQIGFGFGLALIVAAVVVLAGCLGWLAGWLDTRRWPKG